MQTVQRVYLPGRRLMHTLAIEAEHAGDRWSTEIDIEYTNSLVSSNERKSKLGGNRRFADATFAGHDEDDVLDAVELRGLLHCWEEGGGVVRKGG